MNTEIGNRVLELSAQQALQSNVPAKCLPVTFLIFFFKHWERSSFFFFPSFAHEERIKFENNVFKLAELEEPRAELSIPFRAEEGYRDGVRVERLF